MKVYKRLIQHIYLRFNLRHHSTEIRPFSSPLGKRFRKLFLVLSLGREASRIVFKTSSAARITMIRRHLRHLVFKFSIIISQGRRGKYFFNTRVNEVRVLPVIRHLTTGPFFLRRRSWKLILKIYFPTEAVSSILSPTEFQYYALNVITYVITPLFLFFP